MVECTASETEPPADEGESQGSLRNDDEEPVPNYVSQLEVGMRSTTFVRHHFTSLFGCTCLFLLHYGYPCRHMIALFKRLGLKLQACLVHFLWRAAKERHAS